MAEFQNPFFTSASEDVEAEYESGVRALQRGDANAASRHFVSAAQGGQVSALFNLSLLWGGGSVTPYDFDLAADCWYKAAEAGHPRAKAALWHLEAADRGGYGADNLAKFAEEANSSGELIPSIMISAARFYDVICRKYGATVDVIAYELDAAAKSDFYFVHSFIERTGIDKSFYEGGLERLKAGSAADQITDGLNKLTIAMMRSGLSDRLALMARCSIVGHIIAKSPYGDRSEPLRGVDTFFAEEASHLMEDEMFGIFNKKPDFDKLFSSQSEIRNYIYKDRSKTSTILGDDEFINAWLSSKNVGQVTAVINDEALKGDVPSIKQMIWLCDIYFEDAEKNARDGRELLAIKTQYMKDRVMFCQKAIDRGLKDQSYYAMTSSARLFNLRSALPNSENDPITRDALMGIIKYAKLFIESGSHERDLIADAKGALEHYSPLAALWR